MKTFRIDYICRDVKQGFIASDFQKYFYIVKCETRKEAIESIFKEWDITKSELTITQINEVSL